jgi:hypothetical protein
MDEETTEALTYAASLAHQVLAVHIREASDARSIENEWTQSGTCLPLVVVDASGGDCAIAFRRALEVLRRSELLDQITVVVPANRAPGTGLGDWRDALTSGSAVIVRRMLIAGKDAS